ncbi:MAG: type ISP restriction/modification enzyme [Thermoguttaceae bacterium]|jgi:hypothetical protein|nr:type ISP restriction/modification enzyme [Thermoguttaceae bacterium]
MRHRRATPDAPGSMPEPIDYDAAGERLPVGDGYVERVPPAVWHYEVSGKHVLRQWFSHRQKDRSRPIIGDRPPPSKLGEVQPDPRPAEIIAAVPKEGAEIVALDFVGERVDNGAE